MDKKTDFTYRGSFTREISFPLGGIGTGCIGLAGNGRLVDWEIYNRPNKGNINGFSHFAIKAENQAGVVDARVIQSDLHPPYSGGFAEPQFASFGFGPRREYLTGLPHFRDLEFTGKFPLAALRFIDPRFPGEVSLQAYNPFIPLNEFDSGIPAAFFEFQVTNTTSASLTYTLAGTLNNPLPEANLNSVKGEEDRLYLFLRQAVDQPGASPVGQGDLTLAVEGPDLSSQAYWFRGAWFDSLEIYWREFCQPGGLKARQYPAETAGKGNPGSLAARLELEPGESGRVRFLISWNFPYYENTWNEAANQAARAHDRLPYWKNYYATRFADSLVSARYALENWDRLLAETRLFQETLYASDLEPVVLEAVAANLAVLKSPTVLRLEDGTFYGFEGCNVTAGCCEGSCTHVWNYAQAVAFLFPALERSMRAADFEWNQRPDGAMRFRLPLPAGITAEDYWVFHPCADGQFGNVLKTYADWKIVGSLDWLRGHWPAVRRAIEFAWTPSNEYRWDPHKTGVLTGRMHHTLDMELFGPDAWLNGFYLAALKAGAEMAAALGEDGLAAEYRAIFARGKAWVDQNLFNGQYYHQRIDLNERSILESFSASGPAMTGSVLDAYWNPEYAEIKYQIGEGCEIDQLLAQYHANLYGLGEIFDPSQALTALRSLFRHNFKTSMRDFYNPCRVFALNDEAGLVMCEWPTGVRKPMIPIPYSQEVMTGFEYAAAVLMIQSGLVQEGLQVVEAVRGRYDGEKRNPWNEIECGSNYARTLASYGLLLAFSGFTFDLNRCMIGFNPVHQSARFQTFWSLGSGWGVYCQDSSRIEIEVLYGTLELRELRLPFLAPGEIRQVQAAGRAAAFRQSADAVLLSEPVRLAPGTVLALTRA